MSNKFKQFHDESQTDQPSTTDLELASPHLKKPKSRSTLYKVILLFGMIIALIAALEHLRNISLYFTQEKVTIPENTSTPGKPVPVSPPQTTTPTTCPSGSTTVATPKDSEPTTTTSPKDSEPTPTTSPKDSEPTSTASTKNPETTTDSGQPLTAPLVKQYPEGATAADIPDLQEGWIYSVEDSPLKKLCDKTQFRKNIWINSWGCTAGLINVRNDLMTLIRWAIDGGVGLIIPQLGIRSKSDYRNFGASRQPPSFFFDWDHASKILSEHCPNLPIRYNTDGIPQNKWYKSDGIKWVPYRPGGYKAHVNHLLAQNNYDPNSLGDVIINEGSPLWGWEFYNEFEVNQFLLHTVQFKPSLKELAKPILEKLPANFVGFHMRNENDEDWHDRLGVVEWFKGEFLKSWSHIKTVYVASGETKYDDQLRAALKPYNVKVESKWTLAADNPGLTSTMRQNGIDQNAVVDYEVLKRSEHFFGMSESSFSNSIVFLRGNETFTNTRSTMQGKTDKFFKCCY